MNTNYVKFQKAMYIQTGTASSLQACSPILINFRCRCQKFLNKHFIPFHNEAIQEVLLNVLTVGKKNNLKAKCTHLWVFTTNYEMTKYTYHIETKQLFIFRPTILNRDDHKTARPYNSAG